MPRDCIDVSVIIPTRNRVKELRRCLLSLEQQTLDRERFEVVVVDDGSDPECRDSYKHLAKDAFRVRVFLQKHNGPASARNLGASASRGRFLAFTDDDCMPDPEWLERAIYWLTRNEAWAGLEGAVEPVIVDDSHPLLGKRTANLNGGVFATANMFYRKEVFFAVGGFDSGFRYPFREDTELAFRIRQRGQIGFCRDVVVRHPVSPYVPWARALRARYLRSDVHLLRVYPSYFSRRGISRERDVFSGAFIVIFRNERERDSIRKHPSLLPQFLVSVGLEKAVIAAVFLASVLFRSSRGHDTVSRDPFVPPRTHAEASRNSRALEGTFEDQSLTTTRSEAGSETDSGDQHAEG